MEEKESLRQSAKQRQNNSGEDHADNVKFQKDEGGDGDKLVKEGPLKERGCTDIVCCLIFVLHWIGFVSIAGVALMGGHPKKLYLPRDFKGDYCGIKENWNDAALEHDYSDFPKMISFMNLTEMLDKPAKEFICSSAAEEALQGIWASFEAQDDYMCACCKSPCKKCDGVYQLDDFTTAETKNLSAVTAGRLADLTSGTSVSSLYSWSGPNAGDYNEVWQDATRWFYQVCVTDCTDSTWNEEMRPYTYLPPPDADFRVAWETLRTNPSVSFDIRNTLDTSFTFQALPETRCPYQAKYCVPMPGINFAEEDYIGYCTFKVTQNALDAMGATAEMLAVDDMLAAGHESLGSAWGDVIDTLDTFAIVSVLAFVTGFLVIILLRFVIDCLVWGSVILVFCLFMGSGASCYVRAGQCKGTTFVDTGNNYAAASSDVAWNAATGTSITTNEAYTGDGQDYRGNQTRTRGARTCQKWSSTTPHNQTTYLRWATGNDLIENYCRNPVGVDAAFIWCYTVDAAVRWEWCDPMGVHPWHHKCPNGFVVADKDSRTFLNVCAYIFWIFAALWCCVICCLYSRIKLAVALNKVATEFMRHTPQILPFPIVQAMIAIAWTIVWAVIVSFVVSTVADNYVPDEAYDSYLAVVGTENTPGKCNSMWPMGYAWKYEGNLSSENDPCSGNKGDVSGITPACWKCFPPRFMITFQFAYSFFTYLWFSFFMIAVGQCTVAGACGQWFFAKHGEKNKVHSVSIALKNCFRYHLGSLAFGAFIIALVKFIRYCLYYFQKQCEASKNRVAVILLKCAQCMLWCFEKCLKFLTKHAYIQVALLGQNFCKSAKKAFFLILRNALRFAIFAMLGGVINMLGVALIVSFTMFLGYHILQAMHPDVSPIAPMMCLLMMSYVVARLFMMVYHLVCDTMMQCFIITEEMGVHEEDFVPLALRNLIPSTE